MSERSGYERSAHLYDLFDAKPNVAFFGHYGQVAGEILDIGAGTGRIAIHLARQGVRVWCVEPAPAMRNTFESKLREEPNLRERIALVAGDAQSFVLERTFPAAFPSGSFDCVVIPHALHEMPRETRLAVLREAHRVLRSGGRVGVLELDDPPSRLRRILLGAWLLYWLPYPINFENPTRRDMVKHGLALELGQAGFAHVRKVPKYHGTMQVVTAGR